MRAFLKGLQQKIGIFDVENVHVIRMGLRCRSSVKVSVGVEDMGVKKSLVCSTIEKIIFRGYC